MSARKYPDAARTPIFHINHLPEQIPDASSEKQSASISLQRFSHQPHSITPGNILALQRTIGNRAVNHLLRQIASRPRPGTAPASTAVNPVIQRAEAANPLAVAEEDWARVAGGQRIKYTALAAGCMAVTVFFEGGGAAGVHLAMLPTNANQFADFLAAIAGRRISRAFLDCDMLGDGDGWKIKYDTVELEPDLNTLPRSAADLTRTMTAQAQNLAGWISDQALVTDWFKRKLGVNPTTSKNQNPQYDAPAAPAPAPAPGAAAAAANAGPPPAAAAAAAPAPAPTATGKDEKTQN